MSVQQRDFDEIASGMHANLAGGRFDSRPTVLALLPVGTSSPAVSLRRLGDWFEQV